MKVNRGFKNPDGCITEEKWVQSSAIYYLQCYINLSGNFESPFIVFSLSLALKTYATSY